MFEQRDGEARRGEAHKEAYYRLAVALDEDRVRRKRLAVLRTTKRSSTRRAESDDTGAMMKRFNCSPSSSFSVNRITSVKSSRRPSSE